jgi:two-component system cell cycle response regulator DivK
LSDSTRPMAILIVEDNERNLKLVRDILQYNGYETLEARNAADGVALAVERRPDLILMDIQLPDLDGVTALDRLRADPRTASIGVVALTAFAMNEDRQNLLAAGFDGYLEKPIDVRAFPGQVLALLHSTRLEESR